MYLVLSQHDLQYTLPYLDNTTITVSYGAETHILSITNEIPILIPVMTENVILYCDAESAEWTYSDASDRQNLLTLDLYTKMYAKIFNCTNMNTTTSRRVVHSVTLAAIGKYVMVMFSGVVLEKIMGHRKFGGGHAPPQAHRARHHWY